MGDLTKNFSRSEFRCHGTNCCGGAAPISGLLVDVLQRARDTIGKPFTVNSGFRCITHNRSIGSNDNSQHCLGNAADIALVDGMTAKQMSAVFSEALCVFLGYSESQDCGGIGLYDTFIHVDVRQGSVARWDYRGK